MFRRCFVTGQRRRQRRFHRSPPTAVELTPLVGAAARHATPGQKQRLEQQFYIHGLLSEAERCVADHQLPQAQKLLDAVVRAAAAANNGEEAIVKKGMQRYSLLQCTIAWKEGNLDAAATALCGAYTTANATRGGVDAQLSVRGEETCFPAAVNVLSLACAMAARRTPKHVRDLHGLLLFDLVENALERTSPAVDLHQDRLELRAQLFYWRSVARSNPQQTRPGTSRAGESRAVPHSLDDAMAAFNLLQQLYEAQMEEMGWRKSPVEGDTAAMARGGSLGDTVEADRASRQELLLLEAHAMDGSPLGPAVGLTPAQTCTATVDGTYVQLLKAGTRCCEEAALLASGRRVDAGVDDAFLATMKALVDHPGSSRTTAHNKVGAKSVEQGRARRALQRLRGGCAEADESASLVVNNSSAEGCSNNRGTSSQHTHLDGLLHVASRLLHVEDVSTLSLLMDR